MTQCAAHSKRTGQRCRQSAMVGKTVCYHHGGATPTGANLPQFRAGRYSKYLPERLREKYQDAQQDPEILVLRDEIALADARLADLLTRVDAGESGALWKELKDLVDQLGKSVETLDLDGARVALRGLRDVMLKGHTDASAWQEIQAVLMLREHLVRSERQRLVQMQQMISVEQAMTLIAALTESVRRHVTEPDALRAISADLARLTAVAARTGADG